MGCAGNLSVYTEETGTHLVFITQTFPWDLVFDSFLLLLNFFLWLLGSYPSRSAIERRPSSIIHLYIAVYLSFFLSLCTAKSGSLSLITVMERREGTVGRSRPNSVVAV